VKRRVEDLEHTEKTWHERLLQGEVNSRCDGVIRHRDLAFVETHCVVLRVCEVVSFGKTPRELVIVRSTC